MIERLKAWPSMFHPSESPTHERVSLEADEARRMQFWAEFEMPTTRLAALLKCCQSVPVSPV